MNEDRVPTREEIGALLAFLPRLYGEGVSLVQSWDGGERGAGGAYRLPYPSYAPVVEEFYRALAHDAWVDRAYVPEEAHRMLADEAVVRRASLPEIRRMLTYCLRGERFSDGHWAEMIEKGHIRRLLERLREIAAG